MKTARFKTLHEYVGSFKGRVTQRHIASVLGLTEPELSRYLGGHRVPSREVALRLSREHGIALDGLLDPCSYQQRSA